MFRRKGINKPPKKRSGPKLTPEEREKARHARMYFHSGTQSAIVLYQQTPDPVERSKIYQKDIMPAFEKLSENLINIHRFVGYLDTFQELKNDCVTFLFETLLKFDPTRGTNAFSYFNVVAKNFLIIKTKMKVIKTKRSVSIDDSTAMSHTELRVVENYYTIPSQDSALEREHLSHGVLNVLVEIRNRVKSENELACVNSIITIFENIDDLDILSKGGILLYMRELSGLSPKQLTTSLQAVRKLFNKLKTDPKMQLM